MKKEEKLSLINGIFSPSAPIENIKLFVGRVEEIGKIRTAIEERGQHAVMYGGRGVGKTSLSNIVSTMFKDLVAVKVTCNRSDNFRSIWEKALRKVKLILPSKGIGFKEVINQKIISLELPKNKKDIDAFDIEISLEGVQANFFFIFDEFDGISDEETKMKMADTMKTLSDNVPNVTILIIGIAQSVSELIGKHISLERCILQINLLLMSKVETEQIIRNNLKFIDLGINKEIVNQIVEYSSGFPHYTHLLCKFASKAAILEKKKIIRAKHFNFAVNQSVENSNQSIRASYRMSLSKNSANTNKLEDILVACLMAKTDNNNTFTLEDVIIKYNALKNTIIKPRSMSYTLAQFCKEEKGLILEKEMKDKVIRYKFSNPLMKAFIKLKLHDEIIN